MAKTNFSKVEDSLKAGLEKMQRESLGKLADIAQKATKPELKAILEKSVKAASKAILEKKGTLHIIKQSLRNLSLKTEFYEFIGIAKSDLATLLNRSTELTTEEWKTLNDVKKKIKSYKEELKKKHPELNDEELITKERKKHINKRFNVREKWLPIK